MSAHCNLSALDYLFHVEATIAFQFQDSLSRLCVMVENGDLAESMMPSNKTFDINEIPSFHRIYIVGNNQNKNKYMGRCPCSLW